MTTIVQTLEFDPVTRAISNAWSMAKTLFARSASKSRRQAVTSVERPVASRAVPSRLDAEVQWEMISGVITKAGGQAANAVTLQATATRQLDLAQYGLITLRDELAAVMKLSSRRDSAVVHVLAPVAGTLAKEPALAA